MKKNVFFAALAAAVTLVLSCASTATGPITTQEEANDAFRKIYNEYRDDLNLDDSKTYTVVSGDTLSAISRKNYNDGFYFPLIMLASSDVVLDPDLIEPGMKLTIPDLPKNLNDPKAKGELKNFLNEIAEIYDKRNRPLDADGLRKLASSL
jgi:nucleoid-associated protein YgaU